MNERSFFWDKRQTRERPMFEKAINFLREVKIEMAKVSWPTREELKGSTTIVIVTTLLFAVFIFIADQIISRIVGVIFRLAG
ncbi:MAG: preprotein translocase subunit SecE [candidate division KSB1 bacterium]|nr:preprotein translocase subunit SecE [candidate division KSB1 bacterium]MDZ7394007.1 preprotein translocase subunit SecE [candidate division KSB1 bacterium]